MANRISNYKNRPRCNSCMFLTEKYDAPYCKKYDKCLNIEKRYSGKTIILKCSKCRHN